MPYLVCVRAQERGSSKQIAVYTSIYENIKSFDYCIFECSLSVREMKNNNYFVLQKQNVE